MSPVPHLCAQNHLTRTLWAKPHEHQVSVPQVQATGRPFGTVRVCQGKDSLWELCLSPEMGQWRPRVKDWFSDTGLESDTSITHLKIITLTLPAGWTIWWSSHSEATCGVTLTEDREVDGLGPSIVQDPLINHWVLYLILYSLFCPLLSKHGPTDWVNTFSNRYCLF